MNKKTDSVTVLQLKDACSCDVKMESYHTRACIPKKIFYKKGLKKSGRSRNPGTAIFLNIGNYRNYRVYSLAAALASIS